MTDDTLNRGLEDVLVAETRLSRIDGEAGELVIAGFPLDELAPNASFEETVYHLWNDRLPGPDELSAFRADLASRRAVSDVALETLREAAEQGRPAMEAMRMGAAAASLASHGADRAGTDSPDPDAPAPASPAADARDLVAQFPTIAAAYWRFRRGEEPLDPDPDLSHAADYLRMLTGEAPSDAALRGLETYLNAVVDHGLNASTFTGRVVTSTGSDLVSAVAGAAGALKGPLHGGAPGPVLEMLREIEASGDPEGWVRDALESGDRIMGFGHRVYSVRDPRAAVLSDAAERFYEVDGDSEFFALAREVEDVAVDVLAEEKSGLDLETNVEFYTALLLNGLGVPQDLFTPTFAVARVGGWTAHCLEQRENNRLIRPRGRYVGADGRSWTPVDER
jgi:citrate synthase